MCWALQLLLACAVAVLTMSKSAYYGTHYCHPGRDVLVHLFEWKWTDIKNECSWFAQHNFCAVQVSGHW